MSSFRNHAHFLKQMWKFLCIIFSNYKNNWLRWGIWKLTHYPKKGKEHSVEFLFSIAVYVHATIGTWGRTLYWVISFFLLFYIKIWTDS